ncbi:MAG: hypothetical protein MI919_14550 [Holophagales bacterium]|nr:hypothetical protein [Holophagales bacterium]
MRTTLTSLIRRTSTIGRFGAVLVLLLLTAATAAHARSYTVTLTNGTSFETRYKPVEADWDDSVALIRTDQSNWIALPKSEIADVASEAEISGFGYQLNTTTVFLGWSPNDIGPTDGEEAEGAGGAPGVGGQGPGDAGQPAYRYGDESDAGNVLEQFVDIPADGESIGGVSLGGTVPSGPGDG